MIECSNLTRRYGDFVALKDVTFSVEHGRICALLGHNGAGKSTLLKTLAGLQKPSTGRAVIAGHDVAEESTALKRDLGVVPENLALFEELTVEEHLELCGAVYGVDRAETARRAEQLLR